MQVMPHQDVTDLPQNLLSFELPYVTALMPWGPNGVVMAAVRSGAHGPVLTVSCLRPDAQAMDLVTLPRLQNVWLRGTKDTLAIVLPNEVTLIYSDGRIAHIPLGGVQSAAFDTAVALWLQSGHRLFHSPISSPGEVRPVARQVATFTVCSLGVVWVEVEESGQVALVLGEQGKLRRIATGLVLSSPTVARLTLAVANDVAFLMRHPKFHLGHDESIVYRISLRTGAQGPTLHLPPVCHTGLRQIRLVPWGPDGVLTISEVNETMALCFIPPDGDGISILSSPDQEVIDFVADRGHATLAWLSVEPSSSAPQRQLTVVRPAKARSQQTKTYANVGPLIAMKGPNLAFVRQQGDDLSLMLDSPHQSASLAVWSGAKAACLPVWTAAPEGGWLHRGTVRADRPLLVLMPGLHKLATTNLQTNFLQEFMARLSAHFDTKGISACVLELPGSAGRGKAYRSATGNIHVAQLAAHIRQALEDLCASHVALSAYSRPAWAPLGFAAKKEPVRHQPHAFFRARA